MTEQKVCKLCLKVSNDFQVIDKITREILEVLLLKIDLSLEEDNVICEGCGDSIYTFFEFKSMCLDSEDCMAPFIRTMNGMEVDIVEMAYFKENSGAATISDPDDAICRLCLKRDRCVDLNILNESFGEDITAKCVPEIDINFARSPKICLSCQTTLVNFYQFVTKCLVKQENITECDDREACFAIKSEELDIKMEEEECDSAIPSEDTKMKSFVDKSHNQEPNHTSINSDSNQITKYTTYILFPQNGDEIKKEYPKDHKLLEDVAVTGYHYSYVTKQKGGLSKQALIHQKSLRIRAYDCKFCSYKVKLKSSLIKHMLIHKDAPEVMTYQCALCPYKAKQKHYLTRHMLIHKDISKVTSYDCSFCSYKAKRKDHLTAHILIHKDVSEVTTYDCSFCSYKAKNKSNLTAHMLIHKDASEVLTYQCPLCPYKTKRKSNLTGHMLIHKDVSKVQHVTFDCSLCSYKAKQKRYLIRHMLIHKDISEVTTYDCSFCSFKTKQKRSLTRHKLIHKDPSEVMT